MSDSRPTGPASGPDGVPPDAPGIPGYRIRRPLGRGGMATVWLAVQESLDREVAIKVMSPEALADESAKQRFEQEARTIARLEHPGIVGIHEVGRTAAGHPYYVMPYLARGALGQRDYRDDEGSVFDILASLLSALEYAHARGIVHRDVKAENVLFDAGNRPRLTDFGIALSKEDRSRITTAGLALGSGGYMAPEQARGEEVDGRADLYSVGVLAWELLTGRLPFHSSEPLALALMHAQDPVPKLPEALSHWQDFIERAMAKAPEDRFRNAREMLDALERLRAEFEVDEDGGPAPEVVPLRERLARLAPRLRGPALLAAGTATALLAAWLLWAWLPGVLVDRDAREPAAVAAPDRASQAALPRREGSLAELVADGERQLEAGQLLAPGDDNAADTWQSAAAIDPDDPAVAEGLDRTLRALAEAVAEDIRAGNDDQARTGFARARELAERTGREAGSAWQAVREATHDAALERLQRALDGFNRDAGESAAELVASLGLDHPDLQARSERTRDLPRPGQRLAGEPSMVFVSPAQGDRPAWAAMTTPVTVAEYRRFASAVNRSPANCHLPASLVRVFARKTWDDPPFDQNADHPVVCVNFDDARTYAEWLSARNGTRLRLPRSSEWRRMAAGVPAGQCNTARLGCGGNRGTLGVGRYAASPLGLRDVNGNVSEWLLDCAGSCTRRLVGGPSWRDDPGTAAATTQDVAAERGHEFVGFRLVRELRPGDNVEFAP